MFIGSLKLPRPLFSKPAVNAQFLFNRTAAVDKASTSSTCKHFLTGLPRTSLPTGHFVFAGVSSLPDQDMVLTSYTRQVYSPITVSCHLKADSSQMCLQPQSLPPES